MLEFADNARVMLEEVVKIKPGQKLLVITDTYARSRAFADAVTEVANSIGVQAVLAMMEPITHVGQEPPPCLAAAMKAVDVILEFTERYNMAHSTARKEATAVGVKHFVLNTEASEDRLRTPVPLADLNKIKTQTEKFAGMMTRANTARVTSSWGTDITMSLEGRKAVPLQPLIGYGFRGTSGLCRSGYLTGRRHHGGVGDN